MSRYDATYAQIEVIGRRGNRLRDVIRLAKKLVIMYKLIKKI
jgi:hypothetical protein